MATIATTVVAYRIEVRTSAGALASPASTTVTATRPDGTTSSPTATPAGTGLLDLEVSYDAPGVWSVHIQCTSPTVAYRIEETIT